MSNKENVSGATSHLTQELDTFCDELEVAAPF